MIYSSGRSSACCNLRKDIFFRRSAAAFLVATCTTLYFMYYVKHIYAGMKIWLIIANTLYNLKWSSCDILHVCLPPLGSDVFKVFNCVEVCSCSLKLNLICLINFWLQILSCKHSHDNSWCVVMTQDIPALSRLLYWNYKLHVALNYWERFQHVSYNHISFNFLVLKLLILLKWII